MKNDNAFLQEKKKIINNINWSIALLAFCFLMFWGITFVPDYRGRNLPTILWPRIILILLSIFSIILLLSSIYKCKSISNSLNIKKFSNKKLGEDIIKFIHFFKICVVSFIFFIISNF